MTVNAIRSDSNAIRREKKNKGSEKMKKGRNESPAFEILELKSRTKRIATLACTILLADRRSAIHALHGEIEIANNGATEQYAPLTLICIKGVRIVSISNAVYT